MAQTKIAGLFLDPTVISGLTAITDGASDADYLFVWDAGTSTLKKILPDNLGLAAAAHTIESHTATSATGANLETLTNAGDADALHTHALKAPLAGPTFTGTTTFATLSDGAIGITAFLDADNMSGASATTLSTSESIKAYVDANGGTAVAGTTDNGILTFVNSGSTFAAEANLTFDGSTLTTLNTDIVLSDAQGLSWKRESDSLVRNMIKTTLYSGGVYHIDIGHESSNFRDIRFIADGASAAPYMTIKALTGNIEVAAGNVVIGTAGKGIDFSAQTASSTATVGDEVLNHYEEGQFIPHVWDSSKTTNSNVTYNNRLGRYTRIGNIVFFTVSWNPLALTGLTGTSQAFVGGLPFTCSNTNYGSNTSLRHGLALGYIAGLSMPSGTSMMQARMDAGRADLDISWTNTGSQASGITYAKVQDLGGDWIIDITGHYEVA